MTRLRSGQILEENKNHDPNSITVLMLNHKALSDVSCLNDFKNLEKLDLGFNNLSSLEGLRSCVSLKWLSVLQNKLQSLKGIEGLSNLTVLNAGRNKLRSMDEVRSLISLRALILNDNEIASICRLDQLKDLGTLVLSRNPIHDIGESLIKVKSITKLSLSNCQLQTIGSSLMSCVDLKEVRLAHNEIMTLPAEMAYNIKLQNLDLGNNLITSWSELKVLSSLHDLKNLNLQGNPITEKDKLAKKIKTLVPKLQIFNAKPLDRSYTNEKISKKDLEGHRIDDSSLNRVTVEVGNKVEREHPRGNKKSKKSILSQSIEIPSSDNGRDPNVGKEVKREKPNTNEKHSKKDVSSYDRDDAFVEKELKRKSKKVERSELDMIDDGETPFLELVISGSAQNPKDGGKKMNHKAVQDNTFDGLVTFPAKRKKTTKSLAMDPSALLFLSPATEVGMGGPSAWDN
ncbi:hypothetical protein HHK36_011440 [Tetracentron sinense]|uniref:Protein phosphatase 1 regulatory subunit 7 n=1 Tax=Tetracentron sinense TaxID=13715 RepID=A0A835DG77_TETSI|nr:hypothetical protein HHK36_011440 [Tetracentron sinense]